MYSLIIIWQKLDGTIYYRKSKGWYRNYPIGKFNSYGHKVVLLINLDDWVIRRQRPLKTRIIDKIIRRLEKLKSNG